MHVPSKSAADDDHPEDILTAIKDGKWRDPNEICQTKI